MKTCAFSTLGCKVNQYETQAIREDFIKAGYEEIDFNEPCDVYIINTCTVTEKSDKESRRLIRKAQRQNLAAKIVVTGCYVELDYGEIDAIPGASLIIRNEDKDKIISIVDSNPVRSKVPRAPAAPLARTSNGAKKVAPLVSTRAGYTPLAISGFKDRSKAFLKVQDGCNNFCSYCKVPLVRGYSVSRDESAIIAEMKRLLKNGFKEIVLTGICLGAWGEELRPKKDLSSLLKKLTAIKGDFRIRLSSIEPKYVNDRLLLVMKDSPKLCRHLHMPLQSGGDKILKMMNRPYTFAEYAKIISNARRKIPEISITTDILVGFPSESDKNFRNTCKLVEKVKPLRIHIFPYSKRKGTVAANLPGEVPKSAVHKRMKAMSALAAKYSYEYRKKFIGKRTEILVEAERDKKTGLLKGYNDKYINIIITGTPGRDKDEYISKILPVRIQKVDGERTFGSLDAGHVPCKVTPG